MTAQSSSVQGFGLRSTARHRWSSHAHHGRDCPVTVAGSINHVFEQGVEVNEIPAVVLGSELAARTGLEVGDAAEIITASAGVSSSDRSRRRVRVAAIFRSGLFEYDSTWIYLPLETASAFSGSITRGIRYQCSGRKHLRR